MTETLVKFKSKFHKLLGAKNWTSEDIDSALTNLRNDRIFDERKKKEIERDVYKFANNELDKLIPFMNIPAFHKAVYIYAKKPVLIVWEAILCMLQEFIKRLPSQLSQR